MSTPVLIAAFLMGCKPDPELGADEVLWEDIDFEGATDLGFVPEQISESERVAAGPVTLTEVGESVGLGDSRSGGNTHGVGVGFFDLDGDGFDDIVLANGIRGNDNAFDSKVYRNNGDGTFVDASAESGLGAILAGVDTYSVAAADYDADGDVDVLIGAHPRDVLLRNAGDGTLEDVTDAAGAGGPPSTPDPLGSSKIGAFGDYDGDGWLDIVVASSTFDDQPRNGYILRNNGDGTFTDRTTATGFQAAVTGNPCAVLWSDYDNDGDQDLWIWNDRGNNQGNRVLLSNDGGVFSDVTADALVTHDVGNPMGIDGADIDRNGRLDYYIGNIGPGPLLLGTAEGQFVDAAAATGVLSAYAWGLGFEDLDSDGFWDLFVAQEDERPYLTYTHNGDDPPTFVEAKWEHAEVGNGHNVAAAFADFDRDGDVDVVTAPTSGARLFLWRNDTDRGTHHWLHVEVPNTPETGENGGITGRVIVKVGDVELWRDLTAGSSRASQSALSARFGLGNWTGAEWVAVVWPDGRQSVVTGVEGNQVLRMP